MAYFSCGVRECRKEAIIGGLCEECFYETVDTKRLKKLFEDIEKEAIIESEENK